MKIFIICYLLYIHVNMCIYIMHMFMYCSCYVAIQSGFQVSIRVSGIHGFGFRDELSPESVFGAVSGSDAQKLHLIWIRPVAIPTYNL